jgi:hypothetical protein
MLTLQAHIRINPFLVFISPAYSKTIAYYTAKSPHFYFTPNFLNFFSAL